jgi:tRNA pseudouridine38-40 synthase
MNREGAVSHDGSADSPGGISLRNIRIVVAYDGTGFHGWQRQPSAPTVQACLEEAIARVTGEPAKLFGSGRTDAGVHALGQVANFSSACPIPLSNFVKAVNNVLPPDVRVRHACEVPLRFHARYDARSKTYRYRILQSDVCSPFLWRFVWHYSYALDRERMAAAARAFAGTHDFTSFAASGSSEDESPEPAIPVRGPDLEGSGGVRRTSLESTGEPHPTRPSAHHAHPHGDDGAALMTRTVFSSRLLWSPRTRSLIYEVRGSGFLHHMVRNLIGTLVEVGRGKLEPADMLRILKARNRALAGPTAPAQGLCLVRVEY